MEGENVLDIPGGGCWAPAPSALGGGGGGGGSTYGAGGSGSSPRVSITILMKVRTASGWISCSYKMDELSG